MRNALGEEAAPAGIMDYRRPPPQTRRRNRPMTGNEDALLAPYIKQVICLLDAEGNCNHLTANWEHVTGHSLQISLGPLFLKHFHPGHRKRILSRIAALKQPGEAGSARARCQLKHADGMWRWVELRVAAARETPDPGKLEYVCALTDITGDIEAERKLQRARLKAELALKSREEFLANMSHELRTPLNAILGFAQMMERQVHGRISNPKYRDYLGNIQESGNTLLSKINDLLAISDLHTEDMALAEQDIDLEDLLKNVVEHRSHKAFRKQVAVRLALPAGGIRLRGDRILLQQAFSNLLGNAIKYNRENGRVSISASRRKDGSLRIAFADTGEGIAPDRLKLLRKLMAARKMESSGMEEQTLSFMLINEFVRLHGGRIGIHSRKGKGTAVTVELPAARVLAPSGQRATAKSPARSREPAA